MNHLFNAMESADHPEAKLAAEQRMFLILQEVTATLEADDRELIRRVRAVVSDKQYKEIVALGTHVRRPPVQAKPQ